MRTMFPFSAVILVGFLIAAIFFAVSPEMTVMSFASASSTLPATGQEYANGTIVQLNSPLKVWYDWVNVSDTQIINYALYTTPEYNYSVPIANIVGQHLHMSDGTEVFVASAIDGMEVYRDLNGDGIPQANVTSGESEILYNMYSNMSDAYNITSIQKVTQNDIPHYTWAFTYQSVYGYLQNATSHLGVDVRFKLDHLTLSYDFSVDGNISRLKTSFDIGKAENIETFDAANGRYTNSSSFSLKGLSLSLLYATAMYASKPYSTLVDGQPYNSSTTQDGSVETDLAQVTVNDTRAYDFVFGGNYTIYRERSNETYPSNAESYEAKAEAAAISCLPSVMIYGPIIRGIGFFTNELNLTDLFGGTWPAVNINYAASPLVYRVCFPVWDGMQIVHDPVYVGYVSTSSPIPELSPALALASIILVVTIIAANQRIRKRRRLNIDSKISF